MYQSSILSASPLTALAIDPSYLRLATGSGDGIVRFFDLSSLPACRCLQVVDVSRQIQKIAERALQASSSSAQQGGPVVISANSGKAVAGGMASAQVF